MIDRKHIKIGQLVAYKPLDFGFGDCGTEHYTILGLPYKKYNTWWCRAKRELTGHTDNIDLSRCYEHDIPGPESD